MASAQAMCHDGPSTNYDTIFGKTSLFAQVNLAGRAGRAVNTCCCARPSNRRLQVNSSTMIMAKLYTSAARVILPFCRSSGAMYAAVPAIHTCMR